LDWGSCQSFQACSWLSDQGLPRAGGGHVERVAVCRGRSGCAGRNGAACAWMIEYDNLASPLLRQAVGDDTQQRIGRTDWRRVAFAVLRLITSSYLVGACTGSNDAYRLGRIILRLRQDTGRSAAAPAASRNRRRGSLIAEARIFLLTRSACRGRVATPPALFSSSTA
jgi:hypothetical protein